MYSINIITERLIIKNIELENEIDNFFYLNLEKLFKNKEVLNALEKATDKCEDVANVMETIIVKHA